MTTLRDGTGARHIHVVAFPHYQTIEKLGAGFDPPTAKTFKTLRERETIDSFIDLSAALYEEHLVYEDLACTQDYHFCEIGNRWITTKLLDSLSLP